MDEDSYAGENVAGPSALLEVAMDGEKEPAQGREDGDGNEDCAVQCEMEESDAFEPDGIDRK